MDNGSRMMMGRRGLLLHCTALVLAGAGLPAAATAADPGTKAATPPVILVVGDSLSAEYGLKRGQGWVSLLGRRLDREGVAAKVVNASISGDTTSGGRSRLPALLRRHSPDLVILELGANDALRGLPLSMTRANLASMVQAAKAGGAKVLVVGMQLPPNYGRRYSDEFAALFASVANTEGAALVPFLLKGVADVENAEALFQADRIHPREEAQPAMLANVWLGLKPLLARR